MKLSNPAIIALIIIIIIVIIISNNFEVNLLNK